MGLYGEVAAAGSVGRQDRMQMLALMDAHYENVRQDVFLRDFSEKDFCVILRDEGGLVRGFSTQKLLTVTVAGEAVRGVFSGDTVIQREYWGSTELFTVFSRFFFDYGPCPRELYWFLICKGYKTYRILPTFWQEFYPRRDHATPPREKAIIDAYAAALYPDDYNPATGVVEYRHAKDRLKAGVADIGERERKNRDTAWFDGANPGWQAGNDLCCLARLDRRLLKPRAERLLFGEG